MRQGFKKTAVFYVKYFRQQTVLPLAGGTKNFKKVALFQALSHVAGGKRGGAVPSSTVGNFEFVWTKKTNATQ